MKTHLTQEGVIAGFTEPKGGRKNFGALVLGVYDGGELIFIGHTGGGFSAETLREVRERLDPLDPEEVPLQGRAEDQYAGHLGKTGAGLRGCLSRLDR